MTTSSPTADPRTFRRAWNDAGRWVWLCAIAVAIGLGGCQSGGGAGPDGFAPVTSRTVENASIAATLAAPSGTGWQSKAASGGGEWSVIFMHPADHADGGRISETAWVYYTFTHPDFAALRKDYGSGRPMLLGVVDESPLLNPQGPNLKRQTKDTSFRTIAGTECAWFDQTYEERNNAADPSKVLLLHNVGFVGIHPQDPSRGFYVLASQRVVQGAASTISAADLAEQAARGLMLSAPR